MCRHCPRLSVLGLVREVLGDHGACTPIEMADHLGMPALTQPIRSALLCGRHDFVCIAGHQERSDRDRRWALVDDSPMAEIHADLAEASFKSFPPR